MFKSTRFQPALGFAVILIAVIGSSCNQPYSQSPGATSTPIDPGSLFATPIGQTPSMGSVEAFGTATALALAGTPLPGATQTPGIAAAIPGSSSLNEQLAALDAQNQGLMARTVFDAPDEMQLDQEERIQLLLHPNLPEEQLKEQLVDPGPAPTSLLVQAGPEMKAELWVPDDAAFSVQSRSSDVQWISGIETTEWTWIVTAEKPGSHVLTVVLYRLITYENKAYWRKVAEYPANIKVTATLLDRLKAVHGGWYAGLIILLLVMAFGILSYQKRHTQASVEKSPRRNIVRSPKSASESQLGRLSKNSKEDSLTSHNLGQLFISYRRSDSADITGRIYDRLVDEYGRAPIFKDVDSIPLGTDFKGYLDRKVSECNVLLPIIGDHWLDATDVAGKKRLEDPNDLVRIEIESALERGIPVIPLLVRGAQMPAEEELPSSLKRLVSRNGIPIRPDPDFHRDMDRLISALEEYI
jgi:hypothetical protein